MANTATTEAKLELLDKTRLGYKIASFGYNDPNTDSDRRQRRIFEYIFGTLMPKYGFKVELKTKVEDLTNLAKNKDWQAHIYKYLQPRASREGEDLDSLVMEFYVELRQRLRIPVNLFYKQTTFPLSGNRRMKAHYRALHEKDELGFELSTDESLCDYIQITPPEGMPEKQVIRLVRKISIISNDDTMAQTREKTLADRELELRGEYELEWKELNLDREQFADRAREYFKQQQYTPAPSTLGDLINRVLQEKRGHLVDRLTQEDIEIMYARFFPTEEWLSEPSSYYYCTTRASSTFEKPFVPYIEASSYFEGQGLPISRPTLNFVVTRAKTMTNVDSIEKNEVFVLEQMTKFNLNSVAIAAKMPLVERVIFPQHINHELDIDTAYTWSKSKKKFIRI